MGNDFENSDLNTIAAAICEDGSVSADEAASLRERIFEDDTIDRDEADMLFNINDKCGSNTKTHRTWRGLFVDGVAKHLLEDGMITNGEATWLLEKVNADGEVDANEKVLLTHLADRCVDMPKALSAKIVELGL